MLNKNDSPEKHMPAPQIAKQASTLLPLAGDRPSSASALAGTQQLALPVPELSTPQAPASGTVGNLPDGQATEGVAAAAPEPPATAGLGMSLEDYEKKAFNMLKKSTIMKRPAAAASAGGKKHCGSSGASSGGAGISTLKLACKNV